MCKRKDEKSVEGHNIFVMYRFQATHISGECFFKSSQKKLTRKPLKKNNKIKTIPKSNGTVPLTAVTNGEKATKNRMRQPLETVTQCKNDHTKLKTDLFFKGSHK